MKPEEIFENIEAGIIITDYEGDILFANSHALAFSGIEKPEQRKEFLKKLKELGKVENFEIEVKTIGGEKKHVIVNSKEIIFNDKKAILTSFVDITELKNTELILDSIEEGINVVDRDFRIASINRKALKFIGRKKEEIIGRKCYEVFHNYDKPCSFCIAKEVFESGMPIKCSREAFLPGKKAYIEISAYPLKENSKVSKVIEVVRDITKDVERQKELEKIIAEKTAFLSSVLNSIKDAIVVIDKDYKILEINEYALKSVGRRKEEVIGKPCYVAFFAKPKPCEWCQCREAFEKAAPSYGRIELVDDKGNITYWDDYTYPVIENGEVKKVIEVVKNVTDRVMLEERYKILFEHAYDAILVVNVYDESIVDANKAALQLLGYSKNELMKMKFRSIISEDDRNTYKKHRANLIEKGFSMSEIKIIKKSGEKRHARLSCSLIKYDKKAFAIAMLEDITEKKKAEKAIMESEQRFRKLFDVAPEGFVVFDESLSIIDCDKSFSEFFEKAKSEIISSSLKELLGIDNWKKVENIAEKLEKEKAAVETFRVIIQGREKRSEKLLRFSFGFIESFEKRKKIVAAIVSDITKEKKSEEEIRKAYMELEKRTRELERINRFLVGRELRMVELKNRIKELEEEIKSLRGEYARNL